MRFAFIVLALLFGTATTAVAGTVNCPDLAAAVQVGGCPTEKELQYTFTGYCGDNARMYDKDKDTCASFDSYRVKKNVALWESGDGVFHAYLSCDRSPNEFKTAKVTGISISRQGKLTRVVCTYGDGVTFVHRTKAECRVEGDGNCTANPAACQARCD
jgi:hypothetical protein